MRLEKGLASMTMLDREQTYFVTCWLNMVHQHSIDSYRVRVMCPLAFLNEFDKVLVLGNEQEKLALLEEVSDVLRSDPILKATVLHSSSELFLSQLADKSGLAKKEHVAIASSMFGYALAELKDALKQHYIACAFEFLEGVLTKESMKASLQDERFQAIQLATGFLLSSLLYAGFSLESLFAIYSQIWVPRRVKASYKFERKFQLAKALLTELPHKYTVVLSLDLVSKPEDICDTIGEVTFTLQSPIALQAGHKDSAYLDTQGKRLFASTEVIATDPRAAGAVAFDRVNNIVNLLRFEYEQSRIQMPDLFAFVEVGKEGTGAKVYPIPRMVPNPPVVIDGAEVTNFIKSVNKVMSESTFSVEGRDRIYSAFRLYRLGLDSTTLENKLLNWWTAVEYLVRGSQGIGSIGASVEAAMAPSLSLTYLPKLLTAVRNSVVEAGGVVNDATGNPIALRSLSIAQTFEVFRDAAIQAQILNLVSFNPYIHRMTELLLIDVVDPKKIKTRLESHDKRVRWQIARIYRARCDIVHSAGRSVNTALLCSNLEYYLKTMLHALLRHVQRVPTLSGPREFFDRRNYLFGNVKADLADGKFEKLRTTLEL